MFRNLFVLCSLNSLNIIETKFKGDFLKNINIACVWNIHIEGILYLGFDNWIILFIRYILIFI